MADRRYWEQDTPIGTITVVVGDAGLCRLGLPGAHVDVDDAHPERDDEVATELDEYFTGYRSSFTMPVDLSEVGGEFAREVLGTLHDEVSFGETVTYGELAAMAGRPKAARAVGSAMANNPVPIVVPCHRVLASGGSLGGYGGGLETKKTLLALEGVGA